MEDFSTYTSTANMISDPRNIYTSFGDANPDRIHLDQSVGVPALGLTQSMRYDWPNNAGKDYELRRVLVMPDDLTEAWIEVWLRMSPSFTTNGPQTGNPDWKTFFAHTTPDGSGRFEFKIGTGCGNRIVVGEAASSPYQEIETGQMAVSEMDSPGDGKYWDGEWYRYRVHYKIGSGSNGIVQMWIMPHDGADVLYVDQHNVNWGRNYDSIDWLYLGANMNKGTSRTMSAWWGAVRVWNRARTTTIQRCLIAVSSVARAGPRAARDRSVRPQRCPDLDTRQAPA